MALPKFLLHELNLFSKIKDATRSNITEWNYRYSFPKTKKQKERADELHWEASIRYYLAQNITNQEILFRKSSRGVDLKTRDCKNITGVDFTAELRFTYRDPPRSWNVLTPSRIRKDTDLYLILLPNDGKWINRRKQGFPDLQNMVKASAVKVEPLSTCVALAMIKL